ncbi:MAG: glycosyltransferase, partial [Candidatus Binatia bacterium]|nr:glycosyltransferase [Candidatus Binatia bacterium]
PVRPLRPPLSFPPTVVCTGRLVWEKGVDVLVRAFAEVVTHLSEARLLIVGEGPERQSLEKLITTLGLSSRVALLGYMPRDEAERVCATAWVQAVPSRWAEPFGLVAAEALMRGTTVVASNIGGLAEVVQDGQTGLLVPPGDVDALAEALLRLLRDRELAEQLGRAGRRRALAHFNEDTSIERFIEVYHGLCQGRAGRTGRGR